MKLQLFLKNVCYKNNKTLKEFLFVDILIL